MARFSRYRRSYANVRKFGMRSSAKYAFRKGGRGRRYAGISLMYGAGAAAGYFAPRLHPMQDLAITTLAVLPISLPYNLKKITQGYVLGMIVKNFLPSIGGMQGSTDNFTV
jgi:hypothetical protein